jgi:hypothetical protein
MSRANENVFTLYAYVAEEYPLHSLMKMTTSNGQMTIATPGDFAVGRLISHPRSYPGNAGIACSKFDRELDVMTLGVVAAGDRVKIHSNDPITNEQVFEKFVPGTDDLSLDQGIVYEMDGTTATILTSA